MSNWPGAIEPPSQVTVSTTWVTSPSSPPVIGVARVRFATVTVQPGLTWGRTDWIVTSFGICTSSLTVLAVSLSLGTEMVTMP